MAQNASDDEKFMRIALAEAAKANPSPNPKVGAVIAKNGELLSKGFHAEAGTPHAEIIAMQKLLPSQLSGSTLYVTLEPCSHYGRTPPCTTAIINSKIARVVFGAHDANPKVQGEEILLHANIDVVGGVLEKESRELNKFFFFAMENSRPHVTLKWAMSADGKISTAGGASKWITCEEMRMRARQIRGSSDAVLVGVGTILADNPTLGGPKHRIVLDSHLRTPANSKIFGSGNVVIFALKKGADMKRKAVLEKYGAKVFLLSHTTPKAILFQLHKLEIRSCFVEGGGETHARFVQQKLYDRIIIYLSPKLIGGKDAKTPVEGEGVKNVPKMPAHAITSITKIGNDVEIVMEKSF